MILREKVMGSILCPCSKLSLFKNCRRLSATKCPRQLDFVNVSLVFLLAKYKCGPISPQKRRTRWPCGKSWLRSRRRAPDSKPDSSEDPSCVWS
ncbi:hypothetical protein AVEN_58909-1 [Araneus ventricosus]|uniref:Uncharacterized protein n=1 Tax=Araneus ventricosus TaxID=182803 RepID=A0A4Y2ESV1_ARAVE|nr:hypothetical protein AVEN_58909-1 [Araneus ventricosus]